MRYPLLLVKCFEESLQRQCALRWLVLFHYIFHLHSMVLQHLVGLNFIPSHFVPYGTNPSLSIVSTDVKYAFNSVSRDSILSETKLKFLELLICQADAWEFKYIDLY